MPPEFPHDLACASVSPDLRSQSLGERRLDIVLMYPGKVSPIPHARPQLIIRLRIPDSLDRLLVHLIHRPPHPVSMGLPRPLVQLQSPGHIGLRRQLRRCRCLREDLQDGCCKGPGIVDGQAPSGGEGAAVGMRCVACQRNPTVDEDPRVQPLGRCVGVDPQVRGSFNDGTGERAPVLVQLSQDRDIAIRIPDGVLVGGIRRIWVTLVGSHHCE